MNQPDARATARTRSRYQRIAPFYDAMEILAERRYRPWRQQLWSLVRGPKVLEVGVGTGKNLPFYPGGMEVTALDLTPGMLERARRRADRLHLDVKLELGDVQALQFSDATFDTAVATFVFCSVPDPVLGLRELRRVVKRDGRILLLEHVRSPNPRLGKLMDLVNPIVVALLGVNINRATVDNVRRAGLTVDKVDHLAFGGIFKLVVARPTPRPGREP